MDHCYYLQSATAMRFVWNLFVFGMNKAQVIAAIPNAMLVYLDIVRPNTQGFIGDF
jgi:hypothetical protein